MQINKTFMNMWHRAWSLIFPLSATEKSLRNLWHHRALPEASPLQRPNYAVWSYRHPVVRASVRVFKTRRSPIVAEIFGMAVHEKLLDIVQQYAPYQRRRIVLVPVPITTSRLRERGFNQAELIVDHAVQHSDTYTCAKHTLIKQRETNKQAVHTDRNKRMANVIGAFSGHKSSKIAPHDVLVIVDDVTTTGATLSACEKALRGAGYRNHIVGLAVAH